MDARITIKLSDTLHRRAKAVASLRREKLSEVMCAALENYVREALEEIEDIRLADETEARAAGQESLREHKDIGQRSSR